MKGAAIFGEFPTVVSDVTRSVLDDKRYTQSWVKDVDANIIIEFFWADKFSLGSVLPDFAFKIAKIRRKYAAQNRFHRGAVCGNIILESIQFTFKRQIVRDNFNGQWFFGHLGSLLT
jgi:hypothetical protein